MNTPHKIGLAAALAVALLGAGCGGDDDEPTPNVAIQEVPDSAGTSSSAFVSYLQSLGASDDDTEPLTLKDSFAVPPDDDAEPLPVS